MSLNEEAIAREHLNKFIYLVREDLKFALDAIVAKIIPTELYKLTTDAWEGLKGIFDEASKKLYDIRAKEFEAVGLLGKQLEFKIQTFHYWRKQFREMISSVSDIISNVRIMNVLRRLFKVTNSIFGSLTAISTLTPLIDPLSEFKDTLESLIP